MLRSFIHLFKDRRVRSEVVDDEPPVSTPVSTVGLIEDSVGQAQTMSSVVNEVAINLSSASAPLGESREVLLEGGQCIVSEHNSEWVEVDLSAQCAGSNEGDACKLQLKVTGANDSEDNSDLAARRTEAPSTSHSQDVSLVDNKGTSMETCIGQQQQHDITITVQVPPPQQNNLDPHKGQEVVFPRTVSAVSTDSLAEYCRICQQPTDEPLIELGCHCRGELAKAHRTCIQQWFNNKGTNKCEVCRHVATNLPAPISQPLQNFWAWRISRSYGHRTLRRWQGRGQFHPLFAALLILVAGLMFDVLISYYLGSSALPVNIIIGVLVVLGLGTAARLIMECCHERSIRRSIRRMEMAADMDHLQLSNGL